MNPVAPDVRGFCPGAHRPMQTGDGLIVRVRPPRGRLTPEAARTLAMLSARFGNGQIDITRRAGLQIRGVTPERWPRLLDALDAAGLVDPDRASEAARALIVPPLAGLDPTAPLDASPLVAALEARMASHPAFRDLPPKLGTLLDDGGRADLSATRADIRLEAIAADRIRVGLDTAAGPDWIGTASPDSVPDILTALAAAIGAAQPEERRARVRALMRQRDFRAAAIARASAVGLDPAVDPRPRPARPALVGPVDAGPAVALATVAPFGRLDADTFLHLADLAPDGDLRLAPEHGLIRTGLAGATAAAAALRLGRALITRAEDPRLAVAACAGRPDCASAHSDVRAIARAVAPFARRLGPGVTLHVSGCPKGCARDAATRLTVTATATGLALIPDGRADGVPVAEVADSAALAAHLVTLAGAPRP